VIVPRKPDVDFSNPQIIVIGFVELLGGIVIKDAEYFKSEAFS
jgi:hypothetical protein